MIQKLFLFLFFIQGLFLFSPISAQKAIHVKWSVVATLPVSDSIKENPGLAGAFTGVHNNVLLIAGGANFPYAMPWEGGKKNYWEDVYVLIKRNDKNFSWYSKEKFKLKQKIAYGASVSTAEGIVCIGGENENGFSDIVFLLQWDEVNKKIVIKDLPSIPTPLTNASAVAAGNIFYVAGGEMAAGVCDKFYYLDLNNLTNGWKQLPSVPVALSHAVMVSQSNGQHPCVYLIGGRKKNINGISDIYSSVYEFDLKKNEWKAKKPLPYALSAGTGIAYASNSILLFGGDKGESFHQTEMLIAAINAEKDEPKKQMLIEQKSELQKSHPGFSNEVLLYNTINDEWKLVDKISFETPVTTTAVKWGNNVFIPSGEIKAGVRTPQILMGKLSLSKKD